jgi:WD40 repeat protein
MSETIDQEVVLAPNPFPGLRPFKIEESHLFFGREGQSDEVLLKLSKSRFVGVIGPSGSGKSSFIYCGVMPILYGGFLTDASPNWEVVVTRPGAGPIDNLAEALLKNNPEYISAPSEDRKIKRTIFSTLLRSSSLGLVEAIEQTRKNSDVNYLVLVDQFEELFRFKDSLDPNSVNETLAFVNLLIEAANYPDAPIYVAITMRSDFIGDCAQFPDLTRKINDSHYLIPQMTREQKRRAIEGPVAVGGAKITPRLTQQLLNDLGDNPDQLPILQHALMRTWSYWSRYRDYEAEAVDLKHYEAIGTMAEALSMHANEAYDELTEEQKRICEVLFKAITEKRGENFGIRRPTRLNEIAAIADVSEEDVIAVVDKFREPGRSLVTPAFGSNIKSKSMIDLSHESLMRIWVRLKNWVDDEAEAVQMYTRLAEAAAMHQVGKAGLWRPPDLQLALNWQAKHKPTLVWGQRYNPAFERTMIFLEYSKKEWETEQRIKELEQKRKLQRARMTAIVMGTATVVSLIFLVFAFMQKAAADKATAEAVKAQQAAEVQRLEAETQKKKAIDNEKQAKVERDNAEIQRKLAEQNEIIAKEQTAIATEQTAKAIENEKQAQIERARAFENEKIAKDEQQKAIIAKNEAEKRRFLAMGKAMAIKSHDIPDLELQTLIAQHAYLFYMKWDGYQYDKDLYTGLYLALQANNAPFTKSLTAHDKGACRSLATNTKTGKIYSGGTDGRIIEWTNAGDSWDSKEVVGPRLNFQVYSIAVSNDGSYLIAGGSAFGDVTNNFVEVYDLRNMSAPPKKITGYIHDVDNITVAPDGKGFYSRDNAGSSIKWSDFTTSTEVITSTEKVNGIALSPDGKMLAGAGNDGSLIVWDISKNYSAKVIYKNPQIISKANNKPINASFTAITFSPDGQTIVAGDIAGKIRMFSLATSSLLRILPGHTSSIEEIAFNHKGTFMATASNDKSVRLWNMDEAYINEQPIELTGHADWVRTAVFSADDQYLLAGVNSNAEFPRETIRAWPTSVHPMAAQMCSHITRDITVGEWKTYVDRDLAPESTCKNVGEKKN